MGRVIRLEHNLFITRNSLKLALDKLRAIIKEQGFVNVTNAKDALNLSRKYIIAYLEQLDLESDIMKQGMIEFFAVSIRLQKANIIRQIFKKE